MVNMTEMYNSIENDISTTNPSSKEIIKNMADRISGGSVIP